MRVVISSGHGKYVPGAVGYLNEVTEARRVVDRVAEYIRQGAATVITYHDNTSHSQSQNLNSIVNFHNAQTRDLDVSVHFNCYQTTSKPMGTECLYITQEKLANDMAEGVAMAGDLIDRGGKKRTDLFFLNETEEPAILIETCFVDSQNDADMYNQNFEEICKTIAETITGETLGERPPIDSGLPPEPSDKPMLRNGSSGPAVTELQLLLTNVTVDGSFGNETEASVRSYQISRDLGVDGIVGDQTWNALESHMPPARPVPEPLTHETINAIASEAARSQIAEYYWADRGKAPIGYVKGFAVVYGQVYKRYLSNDDAAQEMAKKVVVNDKDALWYYFEETRPAGVTTLRKLFTLLMGLGMRESSGQYNEGRDMSASNTTADTAESGLFQQSWNSHSASEEIDNLLQRYLDAPELGLQPVFKEDVAQRSMNVYGSGKGGQFQAMAIQCPAFATEAAGVCLRVLCNHFGPINRYEVQVRPEAEALLMEVEQIVDAQGAGAEV